MKNRTLFFGDNLEILRKKVADESFDLIYLDPPFNSNRNYNVLFKEGLQDSPAQVHAFEDSWHWAQESKHNFDYLVTKTNEDISNLMLALEKTIGHNDMLAYLTMMAVRLIELHRVLKKTGSLYLHCDPTASHYLKIVMDVIFGKQNFVNEIVWCYKTRHFSKKHFGRKHDIILLYSKTENYNFYWESILRPLSENTIKKFRLKDEKGYYRLVGRGIKGSPIQSAKDVDQKWEITNPELVKRDYLKEGIPMEDYWEMDIINQASKERLGYPTQKPEALLERIIKASSKNGDWILDPFCGCGTTVAVSEKLKRNWVGIDITTLAINLIKHRLHDQFGLGRKQVYTDGLPTDIAGARELFKKDAFEFEYWALDLVNAMPAQSKTKENMRGADQGIDGIITFIKNIVNGNKEFGRAIVQVKGGGVQRNQIATLKGDVEREKAEAGVFITLEKPTGPMKSEAVDAGSFMTPITGKMEFPKIQILTVEELLQGKTPKLPQGLVKNYYKEAKAVEEENDNQKKLL